jgi:hypothetical protein
VSFSPSARTFYRGTIEHCFSDAHNLGGVGKLLVSNFFQFVGLSSTCKALFTNKLVCELAFVAKKELSGKEDKKVCFCELLLLRGGRKM